MAARQGTQSNAMLYTLITFVALFVIATVCAVIFYIKSEEYRTGAETSNAKLDQVANRSEQGQLIKIVGKPIDNKSYLGTMEQVVNDLYTIILGTEVPADTPATVKFNEVSMVTVSTLEELGDDYNAALGKNNALLAHIKDLKQKLDNSRAELNNADALVSELQIDLEDGNTQLEQERQSNLAELNRFQASVDQIRNSFDELKVTWDDNQNDLIQDMENKLETVQNTLRTKQLDLEQTEKKLDEKSDLLDDALVKLESIKPKPAIEVQAYEPDAKIVRVDLQNGIVYLNVGTKNRIYRGLTFAVYDTNKPIPETGEGKAEIEVFQTSDQACAARILKSDTKNPIVMEDIVANLIWDSKSSNRFVVAGDFDMDNNGTPDLDGRQRVVEMIQRWGGVVTDDITVDTDFVVIGTPPVLLARPSQDEIDADPMAQTRYEQSVRQSDEYSNLLKKAGELSVPVFNQKRFLYLIGYETLANKNI